MLQVVKIISTSEGNLGKRIVKFLRFGKKDVQEAENASPHGIDSNPPKNMIAIYGQTSEKGATVIIGYLNKDVLAAVGETRVYSTNTSGSILKAYAWFKNDGNIELNGAVNNLVRYTALNTGLQNQVTMINAELVKLGAAINAIIPGAYVHVPVTLNITQSKVNDLKCT